MPLDNLSSDLYLQGDNEWAVVFDKSTCQYELLPRHKYSDYVQLNGRRHFWDIISSPLLLYRLCCLFPVKVDTEERVDRWVLLPVAFV